MTQTRLGTKVRQLRRHHHLTQAALATRLGISPSYLNLIEHNRRSLTAPLLLRLAQTLQLDLTGLMSDDEARLTADLREVFSDTIFEDCDLTTTEVRDLSSNPSLSRAILNLYRAYQSACESTRALSAKLFNGEEFHGIDPTRLPSEEVSDMIQTSQNYFPELEDAAEALGREAKIRIGDPYNDLVRYLNEAHGVEVVCNGPLEGGAVRRYDPERRLLVLLGTLPTSSRDFQVAHQIGLLTARGVFDRIVEHSRLSTDESKKLCRVALANYFAAALLMPYESFREAAEQMRYDIDLLARRFGTSFEQVAHRLTTLRRPGAEGVPFHFIRVDIAGNISKRFSATGIRFARFSGSCPRWNVHSAFLTPGMICTQLSRMTDGTPYFCIARTVRKTHGGYGSPETLLAVGLGCHLRDARRLVYADRMDLENLDAAVPIGISCRLCERMDCAQRAFPPIQHRLSVNENLRGPSFFSPGASPAV